MRRFIGLALAAVLGLNTAIAAPAAPAWAAPVAPPASTPAGPTLVDWVTGLMALSSEAAEGNAVFQRWSEAAPTLKTREDFEAFAAAERPKFQATRARLNDVKARLAAYPAYRGNAEDTRIAAAVLTDMRNYASRVEGAVGVMDDLMGAVIARDDSRTQALLLKIRDATVLLVEGQLVMVKGRQAIFSRDDTEYYLLGAMSALYEGMAGAMHVAFGSKSPAEAATAMRASARKCRELIAAGRTVHQRRMQAAGPREKPIFAYDGEALDIGAEIATALDAGATALESAADPVAGFRSAMGPLVTLENRYIDVSHRQMEAMKAAS